MTAAEEQPRQTIDALLAAAGWSVKDFKQADIHAARGVAIREFPLSSPSPLTRGEGGVRGCPTRRPTSPTTSSTSTAKPPASSKESLAERLEIIGVEPLSLAEVGTRHIDAPWSRGDLAGTRAGGIIDAEVAGVTAACVET